MGKCFVFWTIDLKFSFLVKQYIDIIVKGGRNIESSEGQIKGHPLGRMGKLRGNGLLLICQKYLHAQLQTSIFLTWKNESK